MDDQPINRNSFLRTGLINKRNECFLNAAMQCLSASPFILSFIQYYRTNDEQLLNIISKYNLGQVEPQHMHDVIEQLLLDNTQITQNDKQILKHLSKYSGDIFIYICCKDIINKLHSKEYKIIDCYKLISVANEVTEDTGFNHLFTGEQNDPHELIAFLLDKIHNSKVSSINIPLPDNIDTIKPHIKIYLQHFKARYQNDFSLFVNNFYYYILTCIECNNCHNKSYDVSPSDIMCVSIPNIQPSQPQLASQPHNLYEQLDTHNKTNKTNNTNKTNTTLDDCIQDMFRVEKIEYKCELCGNTQNNCSDKKILTKPKTLIIKLKRYFQDGNTLKKNNKFIEYPETLDLSKYSCNGDIEKYQLYGVINHNGVLNSGHYYSYVKNNIKDIKDYSNSNSNTSLPDFDDTWYLCNDSRVSEISIDEVLTSNNAYMLFYHIKK